MITIVAIVSILHGLTHFWFVTLSLQLVEFTTDMGWTGQSWLLESILSEGVSRSIAVVLYGLAAIGFVIGGSGLLLNQDWFRLIIVASSLLSVLTIAIYWDGDLSKLVEKGLIGLILSLAFVIAILIFNWPSNIQ
jgi:hypothetical protein